jgi:hypothetical protein
MMFITFHILNQLQKRLIFSYLYLFYNFKSKKFFSN